MRPILLIVFICIFNSAFAQPAPVRFSGEALSVVLNDAAELAAISTKDSIFIYRLPEMTLYKKMAHSMTFPTIIGFAASSFEKPDYNDVLIIRENNFTPSPAANAIPLWMDLQRYQRSSFGEKLKDSISLFSISRAAAINKVSGNYYFDFFSFREMGVFGFNHINNAFVGNNGDSIFLSKNASVYSRWDTEKSFQSQLTGTIKRLVTCPVNLSFTLVTQDPVSSKYKLSVRKVETHQVIFETKDLDQLPQQVAYSPNGQQLLFSQNPSFQKSEIQVVDVKSKKISQVIPVAGDLLNAAFTNGDSAIGYATQDVWVKWNLNDQRIEKEISGTAFFSGFRLLDALAAADFLLVHTQAMNNMGMALQQSELRLSATGDMAVFADVKKGGEETIVIPDDFTMQLNDIPDFANDFIFNSAKTHFTLLGNNDKRLQVWETQSRKKIFDKYFTDPVQGFIDASGRYLWVIEYKKGDARRFRLRHIDLEKGKMISSDQLTASEGAFKNNSNKVHAVALKDEANAWYVSDESNALWKFSGNNFVPEKYEFNSPGFITVRGIRLDDDGNILMNVYNSKRTRDILCVDFNKRSFYKLAEGEYALPVSYKNGYLLGSGNAVDFYVNSKKEKSLPVDGKLVRIASSPKQDGFWMQLVKTNNENLLAFADEAGNIVYKKIKEGAMGLELLHNGQLVYFSDGIKTFVDEAVDPILWNAVVSKDLSDEVPSVSPSGRYILKGKLILDLAEANRVAIDPFVHSMFVPGKTDLDRIELFSKGWDKNKYFSIRRISGTDTLVSSTQVPIPADMLIGYDHNKLFISPDEKWMITYADLSINSGKRAGPMVWNLQTLQGYPFPSSFAEYIPFFSSEPGRVFVKDAMSYNQETMQASFDLTEFTLDLAKGPVQVKKSKKQHELVLPGGYNFEIPEFSSIDWKEENSTKVKKQFFSKESLHSYAFSPAQQLLFGGTAEGVLHTWDINGSSSPVLSQQVSTGQINYIINREDKLYIFSTGSNIAIYSIPQKKLLANLQYITKDGDPKLAMYTPEKYFNLDPEAMDALHFIRRGKSFPLSSYELQGNRPDKVYAAMGFAGKTYVEILRKGWQTRLKRVGVQPSESFLQSPGPAVSWNRDVLPLYTKNRELPLRFSVKDSTENYLAKILIHVNGVPLSAKTGIIISGATKDFNYDATIVLNRGKNSINVVAVNNKGHESVEQSHEIFFEPQEKPVSKIVYIGVGVSEYKDSSKNLVYAAKDAIDIAARIRYFADSVETHTLTNAGASFARIAAIKNILQKTNADDVVILSFSGHGMIDSAAGFLFAPHDMNFDNPAQSGVSMTMIDDLLDNIPARKKLLLIDACHSGEQLEGLSANAALPTGTTAVNTKGVDKIKKKQDQEQEAERKSYMAMKELFGDFSRGNGAFMISAAASNEFALESKQWNNGVFTASFLEALYEVKEKSADHTIKVRELRKAIYEKVKQRTRGQQTPTSRQENGWWNWSF